MGRREIDNALTSTTQEVFCIGTELSLRALEEVQHILTESASSETADNLPRPLLNQRWSLMSLASKGAGRVPLDAVVKFVRVARSYNQKEVVEMLAEHVVKITKVQYKISAMVPYGVCPWCPMVSAHGALWCLPMVPYGACPWCPMVSAHSAL